MSIGGVAEPQFTVLLDAIEFHHRLGAVRKEARVRELTRHLRAGLRTIAGIEFYTLDEPWASCGLLVFELPGRDPEEIQAVLWDKHKVAVQAQAPKDVPAIRGVRVSPAIYTTVEELDRAVDAIRAVV